MDIMIFLLLFVDIYSKLGFVVSRKIVYDSTYYHISDTEVSYIDGEHFSCALILNFDVLLHHSLNSLCGRA